MLGDREFSQDTRYFKDPDEFIPERYLDTGPYGDKSAIPDVEFAFGFGRRYALDMI